MSLQDCTLLQSATLQRNFALRVVAMMQSQVHFLTLFAPTLKLAQLEDTLLSLESDIASFDIKANLKQLEELIPHKNR